MLTHSMKLYKIDEIKEIVEKGINVLVPQFDFSSFSISLEEDLVHLVSYLDIYNLNDPFHRIHNTWFYLRKLVS